MTECYIGKFIKKGPTPSIIFPEGYTFKDEYYIIEKSGNSVVITPYSIEGLAKELGKDTELVKQVVDKGTELLTFRHIKVNLKK